MIRTSKHSILFSNKNKLSEIKSLISDYRSLVSSIIDDVWLNGYKSFNIKKNKLNIVPFMDSKDLTKYNSNVSARLKQCAAKQAFAMIKSATKKRNQQLFKLKELQKAKLQTKYLQSKIDKFPLIKPNASNINLELDSRFIGFQFNSNKFLCFVKLSSLYKNKKPIKIPITNNKIYDKFSKIGTIKKSIRLNENSINLYFEINEVKKKKNGNVVGCDQGINDLITLSDNQKVGLYQNKYNLKSILDILSRKKKGSKGFAKAQEFRKNYTNWYLNQIDFSNIKELKLERLRNVGKGKSKSRFLSHWTYTEINSKLIRLSEEKGFQITEVSNEYRSQRCSGCGLVRKSNRVGKEYNCVLCKLQIDSDVNSTYNLLEDLYEIPYWLRYKKYNIEGFYWTENGIFNMSWERIVPDDQKE